jgi:hypothetical protein
MLTKNDLPRQLKTAAGKSSVGSPLIIVMCWSCASGGSSGKSISGGYEVLMLYSESAKPRSPSISIGGGDGAMEGKSLSASFWG